MRDRRIRQFFLHRTAHSDSDRMRTGPKKAAILLLALGEDGAAEVMKNLDESEIQQVGYYMTRFTDVAPEELDIVLEEFYRNTVTQDEGVNINASPDFVKNALSKALGAEKAKELEGSLHSGQEEGGLDAIRYADPVMISKSGFPLLREDAIGAVRRDLLPL